MIIHTIAARLVKHQRVKMLRVIDEHHIEVVLSETAIIGLKSMAGGEAFSVFFSGDIDKAPHRCIQVTGDGYAKDDNEDAVVESTIRRIWKASNASA